MIYLGKIKACCNPDCRLVLPADLDAPWDAGFWVAERREGRAVRFRRLCIECTRALRGTTKQRRAETWMVEFEGKLVPRRRCLDCGVEGYCLKDKRSDFRWWGGPNLRWSGICKRCDKKRRPPISEETRKERERVRRKRRAERMQTDATYRERKRAESRRYYYAHPERAEARRAANRRWREKKNQEDPNALNEMERINRRLRAERKGIALKPMKNTVIDRTKPVVPMEPFRKWLLAYGEAAWIGDVGEQIAANLDLHPRRVNAVLNSQYEEVTMDVVSRALTNSMIVVFVDGRPIVTIDDLYPEGLPRG